MTDRELIQQWMRPGAIVPVDINTVRILITALRERLAQPEPAPGYCQHCKQYTIEEPLPAQPEQEPVAWWHDMGGVVDLNVSGHGRPLYFAPPRREWVGLTQEDWLALGCKTNEEIRVGLAIQAKLKEKNT